MPHFVHAQGSFFILNVDCKKLILDEAVRESGTIPGATIVQPNPPVLVSVLQLCIRIRQQLLHDRRRLIERYLQINTFSFEGLGQLAIVTSLALQRDLDLVEAVCIHEFHALIGSDLLFWRVHPLLRFPNLRRLVLHTGWIHNFIGLDQDRWMVTAEEKRIQQYFVHMHDVISKLPLLPLGLMLEVHGEMDAIVPDRNNKGWWLQGQILFNLSSRRIIAGTGASISQTWTRPSVQEEVRMP